MWTADKGAAEGEACGGWFPAGGGDRIWLAAGGVPWRVWRRGRAFVRGRTTWWSCGGEVMACHELGAKGRERQSGSITDDDIRGSQGQPATASQPLLPAAGQPRWKHAGGGKVNGCERPYFNWPPSPTAAAPHRRRRRRRPQGQPRQPAGPVCLPPPPPLPPARPSLPAPTRQPSLLFSPPPPLPAPASAPSANAEPTFFNPPLLPPQGLKPPAACADHTRPVYLSTCSSSPSSSPFPSSPRPSQPPPKNGGNVRYTSESHFPRHIQTSPNASLGSSPTATRSLRELILLRATPASRPGVVVHGTLSRTTSTTSRMPASLRVRPATAIPASRRC